MDPFNKQVFEEFLNNRDYFGAAKYLEDRPAPTYQQQVELNERIAKYKREGELQASYLEKLQNNQKSIDAYHFIKGIDNNGAIPHLRFDKNGDPLLDTRNSFGDEYVNLVNSLRVNADNPNKPNAKINAIKIALPKDAIDTYTDNLGLLNLKDNNLGIRYSVDKNGVHFVEADIDNKALYKMLDAAYNLNSVKHYSFNPTTMGGAYFSNNNPSDINYKIYGVGDGFVVNENEFNVGNLTSLKNLVNNARNIYDKDQKMYNPKMEEGYTEELTVTQFFGQGHANAYKLLSSGVIDYTEYNKILEERKDAYSNLLRNADLTQYDVYASTADDEDAVLRKVDNPDRRKLMEILSVGLNDKRVTFAAAIRGGETGTYITIAADKDKDGDLSSGKTEKFTRIFIPGLFKSTCDASFENDTQTQAARNNADMKRLKYGKRLHNGAYVGYDENRVPYTKIKDEEGNEVRVPISESDMLRELNRENIIDNSVNAILLNAQYGDKNTSISDQAMLAANAGVNELYPKDQFSHSERAYQRDELYRYIMNILNLYNKQDTNNTDNSY